MSSLPWIDIVIELFELLVANPIQRRRARRLLERGQAPCVLSYRSSEGVMPVPRWAGVATFEPGRIRVGDWGIEVVAVERAGTAADGKKWSDAHMVFSPRWRLVTVHAPAGTVMLTLIEAYADRTLDLLALET